jgi:glucosamine-6-phosphate isomerase
MQLNIYKDHDTASGHAADMILETVRANPDAVLCLAAGDTPRLCYELVVNKARADKTSFARCSFVGLDEWVGIAAGNEGSCRYFLETTLFDPLDIDDSRVYLFDGMSADLERECARMDELVAAKGIDLMLVGVGMNGHIGFNEPGAALENRSHVISLDETTRTVGQKYFNGPALLTSGISLGLQQVMESRKLILLATGTKKAAVIQQAIEGVIGTEMPASFVRKHPRATAIIDEDAASLLHLENLPANILVSRESV